MFFRKKDPDARPFYGTHPGDLGIVLIAALITFGFIYLLLTPQNFGVIFSGDSKAVPQANQPPARAGETPMLIYKK